MSVSSETPANTSASVDSERIKEHTNGVIDRRKDQSEVGNAEGEYLPNRLIDPRKLGT